LCTHWITTVWSSVTHWQNGERKSAAAAISDELLEELGVWGTTETARERLENFRNIEGIDAIGITYPQTTDIDGVYETATALAPE
jgi:hypothetical protein